MTERAAPRDPRTGCLARVYRREQLRYTGRGKSGFTRHYVQGRCGRSVGEHQKLCWQHAHGRTMLICGHYKEEDCSCAAD